MRIDALISQSFELFERGYVNVQQDATHLDDSNQGTFVGRIIEAVPMRPSERLVGAVIGLKNSPVTARKWSPGRFPRSS